MSGGDLFPLASAESSDFDYRESTGSTNADLVAEAAQKGDFAVIASLGQTAGRGRLDRAWSAPVGEMLAASVLLRTRTASGALLPVEAWGWYPLIAGGALRAAIDDLLPDREVTLKWPNDVQIGGQKVSGLLADLVTVDGVPDAVVMGSGINLTIAAENLPTPTSTSLTLEGATGTAAEIGDRVFTAYLKNLRALVERLAASGGDTSGIRDTVVAVCDTVGRRVRVELPDGENRYGTATGLDEAGRLLVLQDDVDTEFAVAAGDVTHLRYE
ncbi:biotin--[acetyl-CoA-carboxylase] ligase [Frondihabitans sucicola]|uniref:biotin--[biotin carboxyl-carrier protein] ligase n=1 Tax=Frondihabitans sucicola TaxID=1268041 RepID=A0ABN6Y6L1_9MICO|nr:biotin--[acetyl-CoA-carboxylase] ligase [Frondihabitans sucicola]BDZ51570.1 biotin--[acetyl-CoA-carboxylase] ligase [Frondihabitans sucicola]